MTAYLDRLSTWLIDFSLLATVLLVLTLVLHAGFRDAKLRMALAWGTWLGLIVLAVMTVWPTTPRIPLDWPITVRPAEPPTFLDEPSSMPAGVTDAVILEPWDGGETLVPALEPAAPAEVHLQPPVAQLSGSSLPAVGWLTVFGMFLVWNFVGLWRTWRLLWEAVPVPSWVAFEMQRAVPAYQLVGRAGRSRRQDATSSQAATRRCTGRLPCGRRPQLLVSGRLTSAIALGTVRPRIVLPAEGLEQGQAPTVRAALAHEWAHICHGDLWLVALQRLLVPILAWHPLFWWLRSRVRLDQEMLADAAAAGDQPIEYAEALLAWAKTGQRTPLGLAGLSMGESRHTLSRRIAMLVDPNRPSPQPTRRAWYGAILLACLIASSGLSLITFRTLAADQETTPPATVPEIIFDQKEGSVRPVADAAGSPPIFLLDMTILEMDSATAETLVPSGLPAGTILPDPTNRLAAAIRQPDEMRRTLGELVRRNSNVKTLYRPQVMTGNGVPAFVRTGGYSTPDPRDPDTTSDQRFQQPVEQISFGLNATITAELIKTLGESDQVRLTVAFRHSEFQEANGEMPAGSLVRTFALTATVPLGEAVMISDRPPEPERSGESEETSGGGPGHPAERALVLVIEPQVVPEPENRRHPDEGKDPRPPRPLYRNLGDGRFVLEPENRRHPDEGKDPRPPRPHPQGNELSSARLRSELLRLRREIDQLLADTAADDQVDPSEVRSPDEDQDRTTRVQQPDQKLDTTREPLVGSQASRYFRDPFQSWHSERTAGEPLATGLDLDTRIQLLELEHREATLVLEAAKEKLAIRQQLHKRAGVSTSELAEARLAAERAEINLQRLGILRDALVKQREQAEEAGKQRLQMLELELRAVENSLELAQAEVERNRKLFERGFTSRAQVLAAVQKREASQQAVQSLRARIDAEKRRWNTRRGARMEESPGEESPEDRLEEGSSDS